MRLMLAAIGAEFFHLNPLGGRALVLCLTVISVFALTALELKKFCPFCRKHVAHKEIK